MLVIAMSTVGIHAAQTNQWAALNKYTTRQHLRPEATREKYVRM